MAGEIRLTIDGETVAVPAGTTLLAAAERAGRRVPTICYHPRCTPNALCRICVVEVEGARGLLPSCVAEAAEGMRVRTRSERVERSRRTILELLDSAVDLADAPEIRRLMAEHGARAGRFPEAARRAHPLLDDNPMYVRDYSKCILCWRCVQVCAGDAQYAYAIDFDRRGFETAIGTFFGKPMPETTCVFCGQCVAVCPTGALKPKREWLLEQGKAPDEIVQLALGGQRRRGWR